MVDVNCGMTWCEKLNTFTVKKQPQTLMYMKHVIRAKYDKDLPWLVTTFKKKYLTGLQMDGLLMTPPLVVRF